MHPLTWPSSHPTRPLTMPGTYYAGSIKKKLRYRFTLEVAFYWNKASTKNKCQWNMDLIANLLEWWIELILNILNNENIIWRCEERKSSILFMNEDEVSLSTLINIILT